MNSVKQNLGWVVAGVFAAVAVVSGFQGAVDKQGTVDLNRVIRDSKMGKENEKTLSNALTVRKDLLTFLDTYRVVTTEQAQKLRDLTLKPTATEADKTEVQTLKKAIIASDAKRNELTQKTSLTEQERLQLQDYNNRLETAKGIAAQWNEDFQKELDGLEADVRNKTVTAAKDTVQAVGKAQGYSIVFESTVAPYSANDITDASIKALDEKK